MQTPVESTIVQGACPHDCPDTCALHVTVANGVAVKVAGDPTHPATQGVLCTKVSRYTERTYHPDRVLKPLKRVAPKGMSVEEARRAGLSVWQPVSWEQALGEIADRLKAVVRENPEGLLPYSYAGTMGFVQGEGMAQRFFHKLGASRLNRTICATAGSTGLKYTLGASVGMNVEQFENAELIVLWGTNPVTSNLHLWTRIQEAKRRGAKIIAIDPFRSDAAEKSHQHIAVKPGTDAALALSVIHVLIANQWIDQDYIDRYTLGFEALRDRAQRYAPEYAARICGISAEEIQSLAKAIGQTRATAIRLNYGLQRIKGGANAVRAVACIPALTGAWRHPAGGLLLSASGYFPVNTMTLERPDLQPNWPQQSRLINMSSIGEALQASDPPIKAIVVYNSNPVAVAPDSESVIKGFSRPDLFTVVLEHFLTDTTDYADFVLPATTQLEHFDVHKSYGHWYTLANHPAIAPLGEAKPNAEIFRLLAATMGLTDPALRASDHEVAKAAFDWNHPHLSHSSFEELLQRGWIHLNIDKTTNPFANGGFPTPSGRCEFYSEALKALGHDPLPDYIEPYEPASPEYPLQCISPPARNFLNSTFVNIASLRRQDETPSLLIHPADAGQRGIVSGQPIEVFNPRGSCVLAAEVSDRTRPGVVVAPSIWWHQYSNPGRKGKRNINALTSQKLTDLGEGATFYDCAVQVRAWVQ